MDPMQILEKFPQAIDAARAAIDGWERPEMRDRAYREYSDIVPYELGDRKTFNAVCRAVAEQAGEEVPPFARG